MSSLRPSCVCAFKVRSAALAVAVAFLRAPPPLHAQTDSAPPAIRFGLAAGPAVTFGELSSSARVGYALQGSVSLVRPRSLWRVRGDLVYQHVGSLDGDMQSYADGTYRMNGDAVASALGFVNVLATSPHATPVAGYLLAGAGIGLPDAMVMTSGGADSRGTARLAWQAGAGLEWARGTRALNLEMRLQSVRAAATSGWYTSLPVTFGVSF